MPRDPSIPPPSDVSDGVVPSTAAGADAPVIILERRSMLVEGIVAAVQSARETDADTVQLSDWTPASWAGPPPHLVVVGEVAGQESSERALLAVARFAAEGTAVIAITDGSDASRVGELLDRGAAAHVSTREGLAEVASAVREVSAGRRFLSPATVRLLGEPIAAPVAFSARELEVARLFATGDGLSVNAVAHLLGLSPQTVRSHLRRVRARLRSAHVEAGSRQALDHALAALERTVVTAPPS